MGALLETRAHFQHTSPTPTFTPKAELSTDESTCSTRDLICFSHLRWNLVFQRPQQLMTRFAHDYRVFFIEEPILGDDAAGPVLRLEPIANGLTLAIPHLPPQLNEHDKVAAQRGLIERLFQENSIRLPILWYYTPMMLPFTQALHATTIVYDCMDELAAFAGAPPELLERERELFARADIVFTGGRSLYEAKRTHHRRVHSFPSGVDVSHFHRARKCQPAPPDQAIIPRPRIGHYAVLDERLDTDLLTAVADARPDWHFVLIGPIVKIAPEDLPQRSNVHYLGPKDYTELPAYLAGWDATFMPFALNEATRFISPTKTPEYLAAGKQVVSTPIEDVVRTWGECGLVRIAATSAEVVAALEAALGEDEERSAWLFKVDQALAAISWDETVARMRDLIP